MRLRTLQSFGTRSRPGSSNIEHVSLSTIRAFSRHGAASSRPGKWRRDSRGRASGSGRRDDALAARLGHCRAQAQRGNGDPRRAARASLGKAQVDGMAAAARRNDPGLRYDSGLSRPALLRQRRSGGRTARPGEKARNQRLGSGSEHPVLRGIFHLSLQVHPAGGGHRTAAPQPGIFRPDRVQSGGRPDSHCVVPAVHLGSVAVGGHPPRLPVSRRGTQDRVCI